MIPGMRFLFVPMTCVMAREIVQWRYDPPYDFYDWDPADDPDLIVVPEANTEAVLDGDGTLIGFVTFGVGGQVPGCAAAGCYAEPALDIGLGLRPDLTGVGYGLGFVRAALAEGRRFNPQAFRLSVASFNLRARRVYERAGFRPGASCTSDVRGVVTEFLVMTRSASLQEEPVKEIRGSPDQHDEPADP
jgi:ribosomal-protein-alanine N-acetyltransferase